MGLINKMLSKDPQRRPTVRQIIDSDFIRNKAFLLKIEMPKRAPQQKPIANSSRPVTTRLSLMTGPKFLKMRQVLNSTNVLTPKTSQ